MRDKVGACLVIKALLSYFINMSQPQYFSRTLITGMFDLALHF